MVVPRNVLGLFLPEKLHLLVIQFDVFVLIGCSFEMGILGLEDGSLVGIFATSGDRWSLKKGLAQMPFKKNTEVRHTNFLSRSKSESYVCWGKCVYVCFQEAYDSYFLAQIWKRDFLRGCGREGHSFRLIKLWIFKCWWGSGLDTI